MEDKNDTLFRIVTANMYSPGRNVTAWVDGKYVDMDVLTGRPRRCEFCKSLQAPERTHCRQCGAPL